MAAQNSQIPKFGDWEGEENYTAYFDKARKGRSGGKSTNPNDPPQSSDVLSDDTLPVKAPPLRTGVEPEIPVGPRVAKPKHVRRSSRDDGDLRQPSSDVLSDDTLPVKAPPLRSGVEPEMPVGPRVAKPKHERRSSRDGGDLRQLSSENIGRKTTTDSYHQQRGEMGVSSGDTPKKAGRPSGGSDRSVEQSPLHPHHQAKVGGRGGGSGSGAGSARSSPSWEKKLSEGSHGHSLAPSTPGRSRLRTVTRGDETPDKGAAVPRFGDWDENDPSSADGFTHIFDKVRVEKQGGSEKVPSMAIDSYSNGQKQVNGDNSTMCCCLSWCKK